MPQLWAGCRMLPPESLPSPTGDPPAARIAASPLLLPAGLQVRLYGLWVRPYRALPLTALVFPNKIPPAWRMRATAVASAAGTWPSRAGYPAVQTRSHVSSQSLTVKGTPCSGPHHSPRAAARSAARARSNARSGSDCTTALSAGFTSSIRSKYAWTTSAAVTWRSRTSRASWVADIQHNARITLPALHGVRRP